ncbi:MAG: YtxH domain-containing protein [Anaerolinea sp.]|nr:YtxH domain-containing protein [Anaerolinea sp.]
MSSKDEFGAFFIGFVVGGLTGAVAALLLAPQSGEETRGIIKERAIELRDKTNESFTEAYSKAEAAANEAVKQAEKLLNEAKQRAAEIANRRQVALEEAPAEPDAE